MSGTHLRRFNLRVYIEPPLSSSGENSWIHIQRYGFDSRRYHVFWEVTGLERGPLSSWVVGSNSSGSSLEHREYRRWVTSPWLRSTFHPQKKLALTSLINGCRSVGIVHSRSLYFVRCLCVYMTLLLNCIAINVRYRNSENVAAFKVWESETQQNAVMSLRISVPEICRPKQQIPRDNRVTLLKSKYKSHSAKYKYILFLDLGKMLNNQMWIAN
jgi:hypothetical protein